MIEFLCVYGENLESQLPRKGEVHFEDGWEYLNRLDMGAHKPLCRSQNNRLL